MDTRRTPESRERPQAELGTETVPVELVDLQTVATARRGRSSLAIVVVAIAALAFGLGIGVGRTLPPEPGADATQAAIATPSPVPAASVSPDPTSAETPRPTEPPWTWQRVALEGFPLESVRDVWGLPVTGRLVVPLRNAGGDDSSVHPMLVSLDGMTWSRAVLPSVAWAIQGGVVDVRRLYLVGEAGDGDAIEVWATENARTWEHVTWLDEMLAGASQVRGLARTEFGWVAAVRITTPDGQITRSHWEVRVSSDERTWTSVEIPAFDDETYVIDAAGGPTGWAILYAKAEGEGEIFTYGSADGQTWSTMALPVDDGWVLHMASGPNGFTVVGVDNPGDGYRGAVWGSDLESEWRSMAMSPPTSDAFGVARTPSRVIHTEAGFVAMSSDGAEAWRLIGDRWVGFLVAPGRPGELAAVGTAGDRIVAFMDPVDNLLNVDVGFLSDMTVD